MNEVRALPDCRHRGAGLGADRWICNSPKLVVLNGSVSGDMCRSRCPYVDRSMDAMSPQRITVPRSSSVPPLRLSRIAVGVAAAPRNPPTIRECLHSLKRAGFEKVRVFSDNGLQLSAEEQQLCAQEIQRSGRLGAWQNFVQSARDLLELEPNADGILMVQDDAIFCRNVQSFVTRLPIPAGAGVVLLGAAPIYTPLGRGLVRLTPDQADDLRGAWALLFPRHALESLVKHDLASTWQGWANRRIENPADRKGVDTFVGRVMNNLGLDCYPYVPSLVDHVGMSTLGHGAAVGHRAAALFPGVDFDALQFDRSARSSEPLGTSHPPVTACLLSWKRPLNMQPIVDALSQYRFIDEILIWNNNPDVQLQVEGPNVRVIQSSENMICYGRFLCAQQAKNDIVYVQDDDAIVHNVESLYRLFLQDDSRITYGLSDQLFGQRDRFDYPETQNALIGFGAFFRKEWMGELERYAKTEGVDYLFKREADKFFSMLLRRHHNPQLGKLTFLPHIVTPGIALWKEPQHYLMTSLAVCRA
ncbi:MAG: hypothetical protein KDA84_17370, partial [Planctomycetaceae bacterium]|nr:hypothetical protein [Planctomycetaceae bacterium]